MKIRLNSVIFLTTEHKNCVKYFDDSEVISAEKVSYLLTSSTNVREDSSIATIQKWMINMMIARLQAGQRVVIVDHAAIRFLYKDSKSYAYANGYNFYRIVSDKGNCHRDGIEHVLYEDEIDVVQMFTHENAMKTHSGYMVVPDVHGNSAAFDSAIEYAKRHNLFMLVLGDWLDYGSNSVEVTIILKQMIQNGHAVAIVGNHEYKIFRHFSGAKVTLTHGNKTTVDAVNNLNTDQRTKWISQLISLYNMCSDHIVIGNVGFAHGGFSQNMWNDKSMRMNMTEFSRAIYGESIHDSSMTEPIRQYNWVEELTEDQTVYVGHDIRSRSNAVEMQSSRGGKAYFLDTGCGKGGILTTAILDKNVKFKSYKQF